MEKEATMSPDQSLKASWCLAPRTIWNHPEPSKTLTWVYYQAYRASPGGSMHMRAGLGPVMDEDQKQWNTVQVQCPLLASSNTAVGPAATHSRGQCNTSPAPPMVCSLFLHWKTFIEPTVGKFARCWTTGDVTLEFNPEHGGCKPAPRTLPIGYSALKPWSVFQLYNNHFLSYMWSKRLASLAKSGFFWGPPRKTMIHNQNHPKPQRIP